MKISLGMHDTSPEVEREMIRKYGAMTPTKRLEIVASMYNSAKLLVATSLPPEISEVERKIEIFKKMYAGDFSMEELEKICERMRVWEKN